MAKDNPLAPAAMSPIPLSTAGGGPQLSVRGLLESHVNNLQILRRGLLNQTDAYLETITKRTMQTQQSVSSTSASQPISPDHFQLSGNVIGDAADNPPPMPGLRVRIVDASGKIFENPAWRTDSRGRFNLDVSQSELGSGDGGFTLELADDQGGRVQAIDVPVQFGRSITVEPRVAIPPESLLSVHAELGLSMADSAARAAAQLEDQKKQIATWRGLRMMDLDRRLAESMASLQALANVQDTTTGPPTRTSFSPESPNPTGME